MRRPGIGRATAIVAALLVSCSDPAPASTPLVAATPPSPSAEAPYPAPRFAHAMAFDLASGRAVMFGGLLEPVPTWTNETWTYDVATREWALKRPETAPSPRHDPAMAYDAGSDRVVLFGGSLPRGQLSGETWIYDLDGDTWTEMHPATAPAPRSAWAGMVYDSGRDRMIMNSGWTGRENSTETWAYDLETNTWTRLADGPRGRPLAYDAHTERVLAFGGSPVAGTRTDEMWAFDPKGDWWSALESAGAPSARSSPIAYATVVRTIVLFGGSTARAELDETWVYDPAANAWSRRTPEPAPPGRHGIVLVYDPKAKAILLFGGESRSGLLGDTWVYEPEADRWTRHH